MSPVSPSAPRGVPLRRRLLAVALAGILPLALAAVVGLYFIAWSQGRQAEQRNLDVTRLAATAIETELNRSLAVLESLALSGAPGAGEPQSVEYAEMIQRILPMMPHWQSVLVISPQGKVLKRINNREIGEGGSLADPESFPHALSRGIPSIGNLVPTEDGGWAIPLRLPVMRDGQPVLMITVLLDPGAVYQVMFNARLPEGWYLTVLDANKRRIARTHNHHETIGQPASRELSMLIEHTPGSEGFGASRTVEGTFVYTAVVRMRGGADWIVAAGMPANQVEDAVTQTFLVWGSGLILSLLMAVAAALIAGRRISAPISKLREAAQAIGTGQVPVRPSSNIIEIREVGEALVSAGQARLDSEAEREHMLAHLAEAQGSLTQQVEDLKLLQELSNRLLRMPDLKAQLAAILDFLCRLHDTEFGMVILSEAGGPLRAKVVAGFEGLPRIAPDEADLSLAAELIGGQRLVISDIHSDPRFPGLGGLGCLGPFRSAHSTPIRSSDGSAIGALMVLSKARFAPDAWQIYLSDLCAGLASVYLDRVDIQAESETSQQRLQVALESSFARFCILVAQRDQDGTITDFRCEFINPRGAAMLQRPVDELEGRSAREILGRWHDTALFHSLASIVGLDQSRELDLHDETSTGSRWTHVIATSFGQRVAVWFPDITERKQQEQLILDADRRKDEFLATLAHELRNPLAPIRMAASLFGSPRASEEQKERSQHIIQRQVSHMAMLLDDLFDISRITLGKLTIRSEPLDLADIARAAVETARPKIESRQHALTLRIAEEPLPIEGDAMRLEQVVVNLLTNAAKFTPEGGRIEISCCAREGEAQLQVRDNGVGIAPDMLETIFEKFAQAPAQRGVVTTGLGIGLALASELARLHHGRVTVESQGLGTGACFTLCLPLRQGRAEPPPVAGPGTPQASPLRILVADDNPDITETLMSVLRLEGHEVVGAGDGEAALAQYQSFQPDVMILDIGMPRMRGDEVARQVRRNEVGRRIRLIAMTGWGQPGDKQNTLAAGFDVHLTKPVDAATLVRALRSA